MKKRLVRLAVKSILQGICQAPSRSHILSSLAAVSCLTLTWANSTGSGSDCTYMYVQAHQKFAVRICYNGLTTLDQMAHNTRSNGSFLMIPDQMLFSNNTGSNGSFPMTPDPMLFSHNTGSNGSFPMTPNQMDLLLWHRIKWTFCHDTRSNGSFAMTPDQMALFPWHLIKWPFSHDTGLNGSFPMTLDQMIHSVFTLSNALYGGAGHPSCSLLLPLCPS